MAGRPQNNTSALSNAIIQRGHTLQSVAAACGISEMRLRHACAGRNRLRLPELETLANHLHVPLSYLVASPSQGVEGDRRSPQGV